MLKIATLKVRAQFQRVRGGGRATAIGFVLEGKVRFVDDLYVGEIKPCDPIGVPRFGFTITKKIGNAVVRNLIRRRLRAALSALAPLHARADMDYVVVARLPAADQDFQLLMRDLISAFKRVHAAVKITPAQSTASGHRNDGMPPPLNYKDCIPKV